MIDLKTIKKMSQLSQVSISDEEAVEYSTQLSAALKYFEEISQIETTHVEPMITPVEIDDEIETNWREDVVKNTYSEKSYDAQAFTAEKMIENAPDKIGNLFRVPPVV